jgi:transglutaminase-like putative cysteine protease
MTRLCVPSAWGWPEREAAIYRFARQSVPWCRATFGAEWLGVRARGVSAAAWVLRTAQRFRYVPDPAWCATDYFQTADETWRYGGDCDDFAIAGLALAAVADALAARCERWQRPPPATQDHLFLLLWEARAWQPGDPTLRNARLGEFPWDAARRLGNEALGI